MSAPAAPDCIGPSLDSHARELVDLALAQHRNDPGALLLVLHAVQAALGFIPPAAIALIAEALNLSRAEVHGVVTFYHYFRLSPAGRYTIQLCQAEACRSMHCETLIAHVRQRLGIDFHGTTPDGAYTLEPVYCLGLCACSPALMFDGEPHGRVTPDGFDELLAQREAGQ